MATRSTYAAQFYATIANGQSINASHLSGQAALELAGLDGAELSDADIRELTSSDRDHPGGDHGRMPSEPHIHRRSRLLGAVKAMANHSGRSRTWALE